MYARRLQYSSRASYRDIDGTRFSGEILSRLKSPNNTAKTFCLISFKLRKIAAKPKRAQNHKYPLPCAEMMRAPKRPVFNRLAENA